jgi:arylsulfatase A-like enzyme
MRNLLRLVAATTLVATLPGQPPGPLAERIVVIVADDLGIDILHRYGRGTVYPTTPRIDEIFDHGVRFDRAWSAPLCSPTRASILTGKYGCRSGIGHAIEYGCYCSQAPDCSACPAVSVSARPTHGMLPTRLGGMQSVGMGKWHLQRNIGPLPDWQAPASQAGFGVFIGHLFAIPRGPMTSTCPRVPISSFPAPCPPHERSLAEGFWMGGSDWLVDVATPTSLNHLLSTNYFTEDLGDWAALAAQAYGSTQPWFLYFAPQAPYETLHRPPSASHYYGPFNWVTPPGDIANPEGDELDAYFATVEALDIQVGKILDAIEAHASTKSGQRWWELATVFFVGDNGNPATVAQRLGAAAGSNQWKGNLTEGGVHVPFLVAGSWIDSALLAVGRTDAMVQTTDLYATTIELATGSAPAPDDSCEGFDCLDSYSLCTYLRTGQAALWPRNYLYADRFDRNRDLSGLAALPAPRTYPGLVRAISQDVPFGEAVRQFKLVVSFDAEGREVHELYDLDGAGEGSNLCDPACPTAGHAGAAHSQLTARLATVCR